MFRSKFSPKIRKNAVNTLMEGLESRTLMSTVNVYPGSDLAAAARNAQIGDTINFAPGSYTISGGLNLTPERHFIGNGATLNFVNNGYISLWGGSNQTEFTGFNLNGGGLAIQYGNFNVHNNTFKNLNSGEGILVVGITNSQINNNSFSQINGAVGIYGYPANNNTFNGNTFDYVWEPIHLSASQDNTQVNNNRMTHVTRFGIELQNPMTHLQVNGNSVSQWLYYNGSHMGISCATAGGSNIEIGYNNLVMDEPSTGMFAAIEFIGQNANVHNNYASGWGCFVLNGAQYQLLETNNTIVGTTGANEPGTQDSYDNVGYPIAAPIITGQSTNGSAPVQQQPQPTPTPTPAPTPNPTPSTPTGQGGSLRGSASGLPSSLNLSANNPSDWAHWGRGGYYGNFDHKGSGGGQISNVKIVGNGANYGGYSDGSRSVTTTDGSPANVSNDHGYIWSNGALNTGYSFTVPAGTSAHTLSVFAGGYGAGMTLTAHLSDGSAADYVATASGGGIFSQDFVINYAAASAGQTLTVTVTKTQNISGNSGSADLIGATLV